MPREVAADWRSAWYASNVVRPTENRGVRGMRKPAEHA